MDYQNITFLLQLPAALYIGLQYENYVTKKNIYKINKYKIQKYNSKNDKIKFQKFKNDFTDIFTSLKDIPKIKYAILSADEIAKITNLENSIEDKDVIEFYQTLKNNVTPNNLMNFYNNIQTLKIVKSNNSNIKKLEETMFFCLGNYDTAENIINFFYNPQNNKDTLHHELFHVSSTDRKSNVSGFELNLAYDHLFISIGRGLNEGYTENLCNRYFKTGKEKAYPKLQNLSILIEQFYDNPKDMEADYFNACLINLITELSQKMKVEEAVDILVDIDYIHEHPDDQFFYKKTYSKIKKLYNKSQRKNLKSK